MHGHHGHDHHHHPHGENTRRLALALAINVALLAAGLVGAIVFDSVALLADAGHMLSDIAAICIGLFAARLATRPAAGRRTFGYGRTEILAALANGLALVAVAMFVILEALGRLDDPPDVEGLGVLVVGAATLAGNLAATLVLARGDRQDLNLEAVLRHSAADALGSLGVIAAGATVLATGWREADPVAGILIGLLILASSWRLVREPIDVLMEAAPAWLSVEELGRAMVDVPGVREVHDLHVWTVTAGFPALAAHVRIDPRQNVDEVRTRIEAMLSERFQIEHTTLQTVVEPLLELEDRRSRG